MRREHARVLDPRYQAIAPKCGWVAHHAQGTHFDGRAGREPGGCREPGAGVEVTADAPACTTTLHTRPHPALRQTGSFVIRFLLYLPSTEALSLPYFSPGLRTSPSQVSELKAPQRRTGCLLGAFSPQNILNSQVQSAEATHSPSILAAGEPALASRLRKQGGLTTHSPDLLTLHHRHTPGFWEESQTPSRDGPPLNMLPHLSVSAQLSAALLFPAESSIKKCR